jgi:hypothetical protein
MASKSGSDTRRQTKKVIFNVYKFIKDLSKQDVILPSMFARSLKVTAEACGLSERTVRRICKEGKDSVTFEDAVQVQGPTFKSPRKTYRRSKPLTELDDFDADIVRRTIHEFYDRGEYSTAFTI